MGRVYTWVTTDVVRLPSSGVSAFMTEMGIAVFMGMTASAKRFPTGLLGLALPRLRLHPTASSTGAESLRWLEVRRRVFLRPV